VLCCDAKSQCQALERTQPGLPLGIGHIRTKTHDYVRHGTLPLFAALNYLDGRLITRIAKRHRHQEWLAFLKTIDRHTPATLDIHLIVDHDATHQHDEVKRWLAKHPRFHMHFTPTSSSWLNMVERFFRDLTDSITEKSFASVSELADSIIACLAERNKNAKRYLWRAKGEDILRKLEAARQALAVTAAAECYTVYETLKRVGSSTPSRPSPGRKRGSPISPATRIASPSRTVGSLPSTSAA
jgi:transposase